MRIRTAAAALVLAAATLLGSAAAAAADDGGSGNPSSSGFAGLFAPTNQPVINCGSAVGYLGEGMSTCR